LSKIAEICDRNFDPRYGVPDTFEPDDLIEMKNVPKVTKCVEELAEIVRHFCAIESLHAYY
jgi:hypothetical protein